MTLVEGDRPYEDEPASTPLLADDRDVVLKAVQRDGFALARAPEKFRSDEEIVRAATQHAPRALKYASKATLCRGRAVQNGTSRPWLATLWLCRALTSSWISFSRRPRREGIRDIIPFITNRLCPVQLGRSARALLGGGASFCGTNDHNNLFG